MTPENIYKRKYEYAIECVTDNHNGSTNFSALASVLDNRSKYGWRLVSAYSNELGVNSYSIGGFGSNSTIEQTILVFERELPKQDEYLFSITAEVPTCNIISPFVPKSANFIGINGKTYVKLRIFCSKDFVPGGLQGDLVVQNVFGDEITLEDVCFFSFEKKPDGYYESSIFPAELPDKISYGIASAGLRVKRYIGNGKLNIPENTEISSITEAQEAAMIKKREELYAAISNGHVGNGPEPVTFDRKTFMDNISSLANAKEIHQHVLEFKEFNPGVFSDEFMIKLSHIVQTERAYGNCKRDALRTLEKYWDEIGM